MIANRFKRLRRIVPCTFTVALLALCLITGCERKERVVDIQTPGADVEVDRDVDTGEVEIDVNDK
jgi:hypothetical protein